MRATIDYHRRVIGFLESVGARQVKLEAPKGHGHPVVTFVYRGIPVRHHVALSPGPKASKWKQKIAEIKRRLRQIDEAQPQSECA